MAVGEQFPEANFVWRGWPADPEKGVDEVYDLHVWQSPDRRRSVSKWRLTWRERFYAFFRGVVWLDVRGTHPPVCVEAKRMFRPLKPDETLAPDGSPTQQPAGPPQSARERVEAQPSTSPPGLNGRRRKHL